MLAIASDHGGFQLKQAIMAHLDQRGIAYHDYLRRMRPGHRHLRHRYRHLHHGQQDPRHPLRPVHGLLLRRGHEAAQRCQHAGPGGPRGGGRPGPEDRGHLPGHPLFQRRAAYPQDQQDRGLKQRSFTLNGKRTPTRGRKQWQRIGNSIEARKSGAITR